MSVDIDWSLLSEPSAGGQALADGLVAALNEQLNNASRPSFLGPVTVSNFDFGTAGPSVEIKDVRDVWRAFDDGDDEGDAEVAARNQPAPAPPGSSAPNSRRASAAAYPFDDYDDDDGAFLYSPTALTGTLPAPVALPAARRWRPPVPSAPGAPSNRRFSGMSISGANDDDDRESVYSGLGSRSVASVGLGMNTLVARRGFGSPHRPSLPVSRAPSRAGVDGVPPDLRDLHHLHGLRDTTGTDRTHARILGSVPPASSPPPSPPARPVGLIDAERDRSATIPPVQMHLRVEHAANMSLTLHTSLQVNYPSALFMSLPLKLVITGLTLAADVVIAYSSRKHRVHITIVDMGDDAAVPNGAGAETPMSESQPGKPPPPPPHAYNTMHPPIPVGQRILPHLHIESEIGHADTHVLRNVGKVERFIVDVVRKTLVEELVFPNFHTIAL